MDLLLGNYLYNKFLKKEKQSVEGFSLKEVFSFNTIFRIIYVLIGIYAAYLSWTCNTANGMNIILKVIFALLSWIFSFFYLIIYFLFKSSSCSQLIESMKESSVE